MVLLKQVPHPKKDIQNIIGISKLLPFLCIPLRINNVCFHIEAKLWHISLMFQTDSEGRIVATPTCTVPVVVRNLVSRFVNYNAKTKIRHINNLFPLSKHAYKFIIL